MNREISLPVGKSMRISRASRKDKTRAADHDNLCFFNSQLSKNHCILHNNNGKLFIKDIGSSFGTVINHKLLTPFNSYEVGNDDLISLIMVRSFNSIKKIISQQRENHAVLIPLEKFNNPPLLMNFRIEITNHDKDLTISFINLDNELVEDEIDYDEDDDEEVSYEDYEDYDEYAGEDGDDIDNHHAVVVTNISATEVNDDLDQESVHGDDIEEGMIEDIDNDYNVHYHALSDNEEEDVVDSSDDDVEHSDGSSTKVDEMTSKLPQVGDGDEKISDCNIKSCITTKTPDHDAEQQLITMQAGDDDSMYHTFKQSLFGNVIINDSSDDDVKTDSELDVSDNDLFDDEDPSWESISDERNSIIFAVEPLYKLPFNPPLNERFKAEREKVLCEYFNSNNIDLKELDNYLSTAMNLDEIKRIYEEDAKATELLELSESSDSELSQASNVSELSEESEESEWSELDEPHGDLCRESKYYTDKLVWGHRDNEDEESFDENYHDDDDDVDDDGDEIYEVDPEIDEEYDIETVGDMNKGFSGFDDSEKIDDVDDDDDELVNQYVYSHGQWQEPGSQSKVKTYLKEFGKAFGYCALTILLLGIYGSYNES